MSDETVYSTLLKAFPQLYDELLTIEPEELLTTTSQAFHFVSKDIFIASKPKKILLDALESECMLCWRGESIDRNYA